MWIQQREYLRVGEVLGAAREKAGFTQSQLANKLQKPQSFVSSFESGQRRIDVLELLRIASVLEADPKRLFAEIAKGALPKAKPAR